MSPNTTIFPIGLAGMTFKGECLAGVGTGAGAGVGVDVGLGVGAGAGVTTVVSVSVLKGELVGALALVLSRSSHLMESVPDLPVASGLLFDQNPSCSLPNLCCFSSVSRAQSNSLRRPLGSSVLRSLREPIFSRTFARPS